MSKVLFESLIKDFCPTADISEVEKEYIEAVKHNSRKIVVLDDDPTGVQTVHDIPVYTDWSVESIQSAFEDKSRMFFILTNSRSFTAEMTAEVHRTIAHNIMEVSKRLNMSFMLISRGDSTLRGHYPLETQVLKDTLEEDHGLRIDGEVLLPFFKEGGRFTANNIHYVLEGEYLTPAGETEFAKDKTFGYSHSHLGEWIEEKSEGRFTVKDVKYISLKSLRKADIPGITRQLLKVDSFNKVVVNAMDYPDLKVFTIALLNAMDKGKNYLFRTAASFVKIIGGVEDKPLLTRQDLIQGSCSSGGLIIIGSHVKKTTQQFEELRTSKGVVFAEFNQHLAVSPLLLEQEVERVINLCEDYLQHGTTVAVYTRRERLDLNTGNAEDELKIAVRISEAVASIVQKLKVKPAFVIAKGGITSSDIATIGLKVKKATAAGQVKPGIPVWFTGSESKFPGIPYIIFPGNVGTQKTLKEIVDILTNNN